MFCEIHFYLITNAGILQNSTLCSNFDLFFTLHRTVWYQKLDSYWLCQHFPNDSINSNSDYSKRLLINNIVCGNVFFFASLIIQAIFKSTVFQFFFMYHFICLQISSSRIFKYFIHEKCKMQRLIKYKSIEY